MLGGSIFGMPALGGSVAGTAAGQYTIWAPIKGVAGQSVGTTSNALVAGLGGFASSTGASASTVAGMAAIGGAEILGIIGGILGLGSAGIDVYQGYNKSRSGDTKGAKDEYVTAGTKLGIMGAGAGGGALAGAAIGAVGGPIGAGIGALIGLGIGGIGALLGGDKAGKAISDSTDEGGFLNNAWKSTKTFFEEDAMTFFTKTIPDGWHSFWNGVGSFFTENVSPWWEGLKDKTASFFTETIPEAWNSLWSSVGSFFMESVPSWWNTLKGSVISFFTETIPKAWSDFWKNVEIQLTVVLPYALGYTVGKPEVFFTETLPDTVSSLLTAIGSFFSTASAWADEIWNRHIAPFFMETLPAT